MASSQIENVKSEQDIMETKSVVELQFTKKFILPSYVRNGKHCDNRFTRCKKNILSHNLPPTSKWFHSTNEKWTDAILASMRDDLNSTKALLNDMPLKEWHRHTRFRNPAADVIGRVRSAGDNPELLTQAWCKFTECINQYELMKVQGFESVNGRDTFYSAHLCEAPGAFITALNHYIKTQDNIRDKIDQHISKHSHNGKTKARRKRNRSQKWEWLGSTLNPYYEGNPTSSMINDDRFILHTLKTNKRNNGWIFGSDTTGDMLKRNNIEGIISALNKPGGMHLVTADGSVDCQANPGDQENMVTRLHFGEIAAAVSGLRDGGHFVLKMFTFFESETVCSLYLLSHLFEEINVFKPATSKEGNSEVYVICKGFCCGNLSEDMKDVLLGNVETLSQNSLFCKDDINPEFIAKVRQCSKYFKDIQTKAILNNIQSFSNNDFKGNWKEESTYMSDYQIKILRDRIAEEFIRKYNINPISNEQRIVPYYAMTSGNGYNDKSRQHEKKHSSLFSSSPDIMNSVRYCLQLNKKCEPAATFSSRVSLDTTQLSIKDRWHHLKMRVHEIRTPRTRIIERCYLEESQFKHVDICSLLGKPYSKIKSSKFCPSEAIEVLQDTCDLLDDFTYGELQGNKRCQCSYDRPVLDDANQNSSKRKRFECGGLNSEDAFKCVCQGAKKKKVIPNSIHFTTKERFSKVVREINGCYGEKQKITDSDLCNRILEDSPEISEQTKILRFETRDASEELPSSILMARRYLDASVSSLAFRCFLKGSIDSIQELNRCENLLVVNFPLLTRLYVGLLHVIGNIRYLSYIPRRKIITQKHQVINFKIFLCYFSDRICKCWIR